MEQICKNCGIKYESPLEEHKCYECKEKEEILNTKIFNQLKMEFSDIMDKILINPACFDLKIFPNIENLKIRIIVENKDISGKIGYEFHKELNFSVKRLGDNFKILGDYNSEFTKLFDGFYGKKI